MLNGRSRNTIWMRLTYFEEPSHLKSYILAIISHSHVLWTWLTTKRRNKWSLRLIYMYIRWGITLIKLLVIGNASKLPETCTDHPWNQSVIIPLQEQRYPYHCYLKNWESQCYPDVWDDTFFNQSFTWSSYFPRYLVSSIKVLKKPPTYNSLNLHEYACIYQSKYKNIKYKNLL